MITTPSLALEARPDPWVREYVGIPFETKGLTRQGANCWGLVRLVLQERLGLELPTYQGVYCTLEEPSDREAIARAIREEALEWHLVLERSLRDPLPDLRGLQLYDVVLMAVEGQPLHVGVVVARGVMLHVEEGISAVLERFDEGPWARRVLEVHRRKELC